MTALLVGYLAAWLTGLGIALGAMGFLMMGHLTGGAWFRAVRPAAEGVLVAIPGLAVGFVPVALGVRWLYPWARAAEVAADPVLGHRSAAFAPGWVLARAGAFLAVWSGLAVALRGGPEGWKGRISAGGLVLWFVTMSFASVDWIGSRETAWYSSTFGLSVVLGQAAGGIALLTVVAAGTRVGAEVLHDLGNLLLATVVLWSYVAFAQYLIVWIGNSPEETGWFHHRTVGGWLGWKLVGVGLMGLHFAVPFLFLLFQGVKRNGGALGGVAAGILLMRWVENWWLVAPSANGEVAGKGSLWDGVGLVALAGGVWWWVRKEVRRGTGARV